MSRSSSTTAGEAGPRTPSGRLGDRRERRREATRRSLMDAARRLFAAQGVERTRINEITEAADVGFGSFYNHFDSKDAIVQAVLAEAVAAQGVELDTLTAELDDPAEVVAVAHRYFVRRARADPDWGWLLVRLDVSHNVMLEALGPFARRDLARGIRTGPLPGCRQTHGPVRGRRGAAGGDAGGPRRAGLQGRRAPPRRRRDATVRALGRGRGRGRRAPDAGVGAVAGRYVGACGWGSEAAALATSEANVMRAL